MTTKKDNADVAPAREGSITRYMEGIFTPLDSEEVKTACRALWDELDRRHAERSEERDALRKALKDIQTQANFAEGEGAFDLGERLIEIEGVASAALTQAEGGAK